MSRVVPSRLTGAIGLSGSSGSSGPSRLSGLKVLSGLSDRELLARVKALVSKERATTLEILVHLIEVERRKLHLSLGYPSLFEYCTRHLGYSSSAAGRRIHAARCIRDFPEIYGLLEKNEVNLSSVSLVASILTETNKDDLLGRIRNRSQKEVEGIVADYRPPVSFRDRARPVCVAVSEPRHGSAEIKKTSGSGHSRCGSEISPSAAARVAGGPPRASTEKRALREPGDSAPDVLPGPPADTDARSDKFTPRIERKLLVQFLASEGFIKKFEKVRALLSNTRGKASYEAVLETALDEFLAKYDPENRKKRRPERKGEATTKQITRLDGAGEGKGKQKARVEERQERTRDETTPELRPKTPAGTPDRSRHIPAATRDAVFKRDNGRCTYVGSTGKRCDATHNLQIDHVVPFARGGSNAPDNLRLLCSRHNKLEAERVYGANTTRRFSPRN